MSTPIQFQSVLDTESPSCGLPIAAPRIVKIEGDRTAVQEVDALTLADTALSPANMCGSAGARDVQGRVGSPSPSSSLPFDVLESIFLACLVDEWHWICDPRHPSITLSRVCASWRNTALRCPRLWAQLRIQDPKPEFKAGHTPQWLRRMEKVGKALEVWVNRSGTSPIAMAAAVGPALHVSSTPPSAAMKAAYLTLIRSMKQTSTRWSALHLNITLGSGDEILLDLMRFASASLPLLEKVSLDVSYASFNWQSSLHLKLQDLLSSSGLFSTPSLRSMTLGGLWGAPTTIHLWPPLTHLDLTCSYPRDVPVTSVFELFRHLKAITTLQDLTTPILGQNPNTNLDPIPLEFLNLKRLTLMGSRIPKGFGPYLSLPALRELHLQFISSIQQDIESGLVEFVVHFGTQLKTLTFFPDSVNRQALAKIFENLPHVETLTLDAHGYRDRSVCSAQSPGVHCYAITELNAFGRGWVGVDEGVATEVSLRCPQLRKLELSMSRNQYEDDAVEQTLVEFVVRRRGKMWPGGKNWLEEVSLERFYQGGFNADDILIKLKERGVHDITLRVAADT